jgi:hypothetical protein
MTEIQAQPEVTKLKFKGSVRKQLFGEDGTLKYEHTDHNTVVVVGANYLATWLAAASQPGEFMSYIGLGTGTNTPTSGFATDTTASPAIVFEVLTVTDLTHLVVSSTAGMTGGDSITQTVQGINHTTTITTVTDGTHLVVGTTTGWSVGDSNLQTPLPTRVQGTLTTPGSINVWQNFAAFGPGINTGAITEAGLFNVSSAGTMFARQIFSVVNKGAGDTLVVTWQVALS